MRKQKPTDKLVIPRRGPRTDKLGAGPHDSRPNRRRTRGDDERADIKEQQ